MSYLLPNIISNCCVGGYLYKKMNISFRNPFIWNAIIPSDFVFLYQNFNSINFTNIQLSNSNMHNLSDIYKITIDSTIDVHYTHYHLSLADKTPCIHGIDLLYQYAYKYVVQKYISRLQRMLTDREPPKFIICDNKLDLMWSINDFDKLFSSKPRHPILIFTDKDLSSLTVPSHVIIINQSGYYHDHCIDNNYNMVYDWASL